MSLMSYSVKRFLPVAGMFLLIIKNDEVDSCPNPYSPRKLSHFFFLEVVLTSPQKRFMLWDQSRNVEKGLVTRCRMV